MSTEELQKEIERLKLENSSLKEELAKKEANPSLLSSLSYSNTLSSAEISRFSRQLILSEIGTKGQEALLRGSVLVVGCGGLGSPVLEYLTMMGVGTLGIMDFDHVEESNLHRQVIHDEAHAGIPKVYSALSRIKKMRKEVKVDVYYQAFDESVLDIVKKYDVVVDASDNVRTRYLVNDACVLAGKPLVSASAVRIEGQLTVYNYKGGPCYRCLFPSPPPPETVTNCSDGGVLGVVPGLLGTLQALEVVKILIGGVFSDSILTGKLLIFNARLGTMFRTVKIRSRRPDCKICGDNPELTNLVGYENVNCSIPAHVPDHSRISAKDYLKIMNEPHYLLDVRNEVQFQICKLPNAKNIPLSDLEEKIEELRQSTGDLPVYVVCRRGVASSTATNLLLKHGFSKVFNIDGGLTSWKNIVDPEFPLY